MWNNIIKTQQFKWRRIYRHSQNPLLESKWILTTFYTPVPIPYLEQQLKRWQKFLCIRKFFYQQNIYLSQYVRYNVVFKLAKLMFYTITYNWYTLVGWRKENEIGLMKLSEILGNKSCIDMLLYTQQFKYIKTLLPMLII